MDKKTLNLGCGDRTFREYPKGHECINYDLRAGLKGVDVVGDVKDLSQFDNASFDYVLASDIIEHFPITETKTLLNEWSRVLKSGGIMEIRTPNMEWVAAYYNQKSDAKFVSYHIFGGQDYEGNFHKVMFDPKWLTEICESVGLIPVKTHRPAGSNFVLTVYKK